MRFLISIIVVVGLLGAKAYLDLQAWPNVDHATGLFIAALVLIPLSLVNRNPWPIFLYAMVWNPLIAKLKGLDFFYLGDTAWTDIQLKQIFGPSAGLVWFGLMGLGLLISLAHYEDRK